MNIQSNWDWKTHQPLIRAAMELYVPKFILELGVGINSTPIFLEYKSKYRGIDNDPEWIKHIEEICNVPIIFHDLGKDINIATYRKDLSQGKQEEIYYYYTGLKIPALKPNLLFVDQFTCNRVLSINALSKRFDMIIYHDCNPNWIAEYDYNLIGKEGFITYELRTSLTWTGFMIRKELDKGFDSLKKAIEPHINKFVVENPQSNMYLS
jgi:hypothetical protein